MHLPDQILCSATSARREKGVPVKTLQPKIRHSKDNLRKSQAGFSITELMIVIAVGTVITAMAIVQLQPSLQNFKATAAEDQVKATLRQAREYAVSQRRTVALTFTNDAYGNPEIQLNDYTVSFGVQALNATPLLVVPVGSSSQFVLFGGMPDTPDNFGNKAALCFGGNAYAAGSIVKFQSDGTFTDIGGNIINGSIFIGMPNDPSTARAVTILGNTGRIKGWNGASGKGWVQQ